MSRIESRKRPQIDILGQPRTGEPPIFRLPLPPTPEIVRGIVPHFICALLVGVGMAVVSRLQAAVPIPVAALLLAGVLINLLVAAARAACPTAQVGDVLRAAMVIAICAAFLAWHGQVWGPDGLPNFGLVGAIVGLFFLGALAPLLVGGRTAKDSLRWAGMFGAILVGAKLPYMLPVAAAYYVLFLPVAGANVVLAWLIGSSYARYYLASPLLSHVQAAAGEELREKLYDLGPKGPPAVGVKALLTFLFALAFVWLASIGIPRLHPDVERSKIEASLPILCVVASFFWAATHPAGLPLRPHRQAWPLFLEAHLVWLGYDAAGPAAGAGTFRFPGVLSRAGARRALYGLVLVANAVTMRFFWTCIDLQTDKLNCLQWALHISTFFLPLLAPFGLSVMLHENALLPIQRKVREQEGDDRA